MGFKDWPCKKRLGLQVGAYRDEVIIMEIGDKASSVMYFITLV